MIKCLCERPPIGYDTLVDRFYQIFYISGSSKQLISGQFKPGIFIGMEARHERIKLKPGCSG